MAKLPQELQGFVKYLQALPQKGSPALVALPPPEPPAPEPPTVPVALEERLRSLELQVSSLRDDFQKSLDEALGPVQRLSTSAADAVASLRQLVPVSLPRDLKDLQEATKKLDTDMAAAQDLLNRLQRRLDEEVSATRKASVSLEEKLEELSARLKESRKDAPGQGSRQLKRQDSLLVVQDQCSQLSTRMGKLEEMVAAQNKQLVVQGDEQREVQQRLLEVRKEALEGLAQAFSLQEGGLPMTPPDQHRAVSGSEIRTRQSSSSLQDRPAPRTSGARRGGAAPQALKWPTGPLRTR